MGKVLDVDYGTVIESLIQEFRDRNKTWIVYQSRKDGQQKVILFDGLVHCKKGNSIFVYYPNGGAVVRISKEIDEFKEAMREFYEIYGVYFELFEQMSPKRRAELNENNPAAVKDGEFLRSLVGLPKIPAKKIWDENDDVIWRRT